MIHWKTGIVLQTLDVREGLQEVTVVLNSGKQEKAIHYTDAHPSLNAGDVVLLNTTAVDLQLGSGGHHFVYAILQSDHEGYACRADKANLNEVRADDRYYGDNVNLPGHIMKLRYTSSQRKVLSAEEQGSPYHAVFTQQQTLDGIPVLIGELHSMLPAAVCWLRYMEKKLQEAEAEASATAADNGSKPRCSLNIVYVMSDGGALPLAYSKHAALLQQMKWLQGSVTFGHAYGGELETLNKWTALIAAKHVLHADIIIAAMGPGIAGTGTLMGFTGMEAGELVNAVSVLGGLPIVMPRISFAENRQRHLGISHHTLTSLTRAALKQAVVPLPKDIDREHLAYMHDQISQSGCDRLHRLKWVQGISVDRIAQSQRHYAAKITTMGRGLSEDPVFFQGVCSGAQYAWNVWRRKEISGM